MTDIPIHTASGTTVYHYGDDGRLVSTEFMPAVVTVAGPPAVQFYPDGRAVHPPPPLPDLPGNGPADKTLAQIEAEIRKLETRR